jgi:hypothetical protein
MPDGSQPIRQKTKKERNPIMSKEIKILKIQMAVKDVEEARAYHDQAVIKSMAARDYYRKFVDEDPRLKDANPPKEKMDDFKMRINEIRAWAWIYAEEAHLSYEHLEAAKNRLLALYDEED